MIVRDKPNAFKLFFVMRGSIVPRILPQILVIAFIGALVAALQRIYPGLFPDYSTAPIALLGIALSLFLGFRNNACYDRWWEARQQWGQLIVDSRSLARQVVSYIDDSPPDAPRVQHRLIHLNIAFSHALKHRLRDSDPWEEISVYIEEQDRLVLQNSKNLPDALLRLMGQELASYLKRGQLPEILVHTLDNRLTSMAGILAACERIQSTPLPFAYMLLVHRTAYLYCFLLPFGLVGSLGFATPLIGAIVAYTFFGLDKLSEELEKPFGLASYDLALNAMTRTIEINLLEALGEAELPAFIQPKDHRLT
jgi:putative membrane protein